MRSALPWLLLALAPAAAASEVIALVGGRVLPVSGPALDKATVVLRDGVIAAVGADVAVPKDARVIDAAGWTLTPGLIDAFSGIGLPARAPAGGGGASASTAPDPLAAEQDALDRIKLADALKARDGGVTTALVVPAEGIAGGRSVLLNLAGETTEALVWRQPAALHLHLSTLRRQYPASLMGTMAWARQALLDARHAQAEWLAYERNPKGRPRPAYDAGALAWQDVLAGRLPLVITCTRLNDIRRALALGEEFGVKVVLAGAAQASEVVDLLKKAGRPLLVTTNYDPPKAPSFGFGGGPDEGTEKAQIEAAEHNPAKLHAAGVPFALVSAHGRDFTAGIRRAIERGLPQDAALRAVTLGAAEALGIADRTGSLEPGKAANLVAWSGQPFAKDTKVKLVFVDGHRHEPEDKPAGPPAEGRPRAGASEEVAR
ncbi:MAG: amidohydrolase family protein [Vicinamibacteria bacterium]|nr:amidohydrolase family protein [Vicinamibacteria bacterium]